MLLAEPQLLDGQIEVEHHRLALLRDRDRELLHPSQLTVNASLVEEGALGVPGREQREMSEVEHIIDVKWVLPPGRLPVR